MPSIRSPGLWMDIRTRKAIVSFLGPFTLNREVGELPAGTYDIDVDEEAIQAHERTAYRRINIYFYVRSPSSTRTIIATPADFDKALERDREQARMRESEQPSLS
jgi:hypothetical protein